MSNVSSAVNKLKNMVQSAANAIKLKGVSVPSDVKLYQLSALIAAIPQGSTGASGTCTVIIDVIDTGNIPYIFRAIYQTPEGFVSTEDTWNPDPTTPFTINNVVVGSNIIFIPYESSSDAIIAHINPSDAAGVSYASYAGQDVECGAIINISSTITSGETIYVSLQWT